MRVLAMVAALLAAAAGRATEESCSCQAAGASDTTIYGHMPYSVRVKGSVREVQGRIVDSLGEPVGGALVELFDHPEQSSWYLLVEKDGIQTRVAACWTTPSGRYRFEGVPAGHYDLRAGAVGFNAAFHWIYVDPRSRGRRHFDVTLEAGT